MNWMEFTESQWTNFTEAAWGSFPESSAALADGGTETSDFPQITEHMHHLSDGGVF